MLNSSKESLKGTSRMVGICLFYGRYRNIAIIRDTPSQSMAKKNEWISLVLICLLLHLLPMHLLLLLFSMQLAAKLLYFGDTHVQVGWSPAVNTANAHPL